MTNMHLSLSQCHNEWWGRTQMQVSTQPCRNKEFIRVKSQGHRKGTHITKVIMTRQRLDTKRNPNTPNQTTQVDTMKLNKNWTRHRWRQWDRETLGQGKTKNRGARLWPWQYSPSQGTSLDVPQGRAGGRSRSGRRPGGRAEGRGRSGGWPGVITVLITSYQKTVFWCLP